MSRRSVFLTVVIVECVCAAPGLAQETLGDLVASGGYDWIIGRWVAGPDEGQKVEFTFDWALDKHVVLNSLQIGNFKYQGLITMSPTDQSAVDQGVDSRGGTWKGTWGPDGDGLVRRVEHMSADGQTRKAEIVLAAGTLTPSQSRSTRSRPVAAAAPRPGTSKPISGSRPRRPR